MLEAPSTYWSRDLAELMRDLASSPAGLATGEAERRLRHGGASVFEAGAQVSPLRVLLRQFESPLVLILLFAAGISLVVREWIDAAIIIAIVGGSVLLGFLQEYRASTAVAELRKRLALTVRVVRDGGMRTVPAATIVPGDVVCLAAGNLVPGDGVVIEARDFLVSDASLTGGSFPVEKQSGVLPARRSIARASPASR